MSTDALKSACRIAGEASRDIESLFKGLPPGTRIDFVKETTLYHLRLMAIECENLILDRSYRKEGQ